MSSRDGLHAALVRKLGFTPGHVNKLISRREKEKLLPRRLAMLSLALESGVSVRNLATDAELAELRGVDWTVVAAAAPASPAPAPSARARRPAAQPRRARAAARTAKSSDAGPDKVMVAYGRDKANRLAMFDLLRALKLDPIEWTTALAASGKAAPSIRETVEAAFRLAKAVVVLMTPDDLVILRPSLRKKKEHEYERELVGQARPNVLFEAGMAFGLHPTKTVVVTVGPVKPLSDLSGLHVTGLDNESESRQEFVTKLRNAGCHPVTEDRSEWLSEHKFVIREDIEVVIREGDDGSA